MAKLPTKPKIEVVVGTPPPKPKTRSQIVATEVAILIKARNPLLWIVTREEARVESYIYRAIAATKYLPRSWDVAQGVRLGLPPAGQLLADITDPGAVADLIASYTTTAKPAERGVWILRDLPVWLDGLVGASPLRKLRNLVKALPTAPRDRAQTVIIISPNGNVPPELADHTTVIDWPMPDRMEVESLLDATIEAIRNDDVRAVALDPDERNAAIDAAVGLTKEEAQACFSKSLVQYKRIDPLAVGREKKRVIAREKVLEWYDPLPEGLAGVGGLDALKEWLLERKLAYTPEAREYGLPAPRGTLLVGISGCGKSLTAKATATALEVPLLRLDLGALKSKFVGDSEQNLRKVFSVVAAIGRCVLWLDEIEKALQGSTSGSADGGVSTDQLGALLNWMQERSSEAFLFATANDVQALPPEFLRKGRFDELWYVDLPESRERVAIMKAALRSHKRGELDIDHDQVKVATDKFTGAEIAALVPEAMFKAFADGGREITTKDLVEAAKTVTPLAETAKEKVDALREWAKKTRARPAKSLHYIQDDNQEKAPARKRLNAPELDIDEMEV